MKLKTVFVNPWVGELYKKGYNNKKIMVLGESHYCNGGCCLPSIKNKCDSRKELIEEYLDYKKGKRKHARWFNTYTKFTNLFLGKKGDNETIIEFWNSILFYNYVQEALKKGKRPTREMFKNNEKSFFEIIKKYNPDVIIAWGVELWRNKPCKYFSKGKTFLGRDSGYYNNGKKDILIIYIDHPRTGLDYNWTKKYIKKALKSIKQ